jgi:hypothetical protein
MTVSAIPAASKTPAPVKLSSETAPAADVNEEAVAGVAGTEACASSLVAGRLLCDSELPSEACSLATLQTHEIASSVPQRLRSDENLSGCGGAITKQLSNMSSGSAIGHTALWETLRARGLQVLAMVTLYIGTSGGLISLNKFLMQSAVFPFPVTLVLIHSGVNVAVALLLYAVFPQLFGAFHAIEKYGQRADRWKLFKQASPIALLFSLELIFGNAAYMHSTVPFLQMMKESGVVWVYILSLLFMLEEFTWPKTCVVGLALLATFMTVNGEAHFAIAGFLLQGAAIACSSLKTVLQSLLLAGRGMKLDAPSYVLVVMPLCFAMLALCCLTAYVIPGNHHTFMPDLERLYWWAPHILLSAFLACALNFAIAALIRCTSAMGFVLTGIAKDGSIVCLGWLMMGEAITSCQICGFVLQMCCICAWAFLKLSFNESDSAECQPMAASTSTCKLVCDEGKQDAEYGTVSSVARCDVSKA